MSVPVAYMAVIVIWTTTPLAIKWSSEGIGPWVGLGLRMLVGAFVCLLLVAVMSRRMRWHLVALRTYVAAGLGLWVAMSAVYWGAQFINSGMISVIYGLSPVLTGVLALWLLSERQNVGQVTGMLLGLLGLALIFAGSLAVDGAQWLGLLAVLFAVFAHTLSAVCVKKLDAGLHPVETTTGALLLALPLFLLFAWTGFDSSEVQLPSPRAWAAVLYLGVVATGMGFVLYFYVLREVKASTVALITLVTPVMALWLGTALNDEQLQTSEWMGTLVILLGLVSYQWAGRGAR